MLFIWTECDGQGAMVEIDWVCTHVRTQSFAVLTYYMPVLTDYMPVYGSVLRCEVERSVLLSCWKHLGWGGGAVVEVDWVCINLPAKPSVGQFFTHTPTNLL